MGIPTCKNCKWSFATLGWKDRESGNMMTLIKCWPEDDRNKERIANKVCESYKHECYEKSDTEKTK